MPTRIGPARDGRRRDQFLPQVALERHLLPRSLELTGVAAQTPMRVAEKEVAGALQAPRSPYQIRAGWLISAALVTGIKSEQPGQITAMVTENVFDSKTGQYLLIPQGSTLLGQYDSNVNWGQERIPVVWTRLIFPDESSVDLDHIPAADSEGYSGLHDQVDWHWRRIFAGAALSTLLGAGAELAAPDRSKEGQAVVVATRESLQDTVNQVGQEVTRRNLNIRPTLTERKGLPFKVIVNKDLTLRPYGQDDTP